MKLSQILDSLYDAVLDDLADRIAERVNRKLPTVSLPHVRDLNHIITEEALKMPKLTVTGGEPVTFCLPETEPVKGNPVSDPEPEPEPNITILAPDPKISPQGKAEYCAEQICAILRKKGKMNKTRLGAWFGVHFTAFAPSADTPWAKGLKLAEEDGRISHKKEGNNLFYFCNR